MSGGPVEPHKYDVLLYDAFQKLFNVQIIDHFKDYKLLIFYSLCCNKFNSTLQLYRLYNVHTCLILCLRNFVKCGK